MATAAANKVMGAKQAVGPLARFAVTSAVALIMAFLAAVIALINLSKGPFGIDFLPAWTAAQHAGAAYDFKAITEAQRWALSRFPAFWNASGFVRSRPFVWPPSTLLLVWPLARLGFWTAAAAWTALSLSAWLAAAWRARLEPGTVILALVAPITVLAVIAGQTSLLIAGLALLALVDLDARPWIAGVLLGLAAAIKPQTMVFAPVALIAVRAWRPLISSVVTASLIAAIAALAFGIGAWLSWLHSLGSFQALIYADRSMLRGMISPVSLLALGGAAPTAMLAAEIALAFLAAVGVWLTFRLSADPIFRSIALIGGAIIASPYAFQYDAAMLALPVAALVVRATSWLSLLCATGAYALLFSPFIPGLGALSVAPLFLVVVGVSIRPHQMIETTTSASVTM